MNNHPLRVTARIRALCALLAFVLLASVWPVSPASAQAQYGYVNCDKVRFRRFLDGSVCWAMLDTGWVCEIVGTAAYNGASFYKVKTGVPNHTDRSYTGFIQDTYLTVMTENEVTAYLAGLVTATPLVTATASADAATATPAATAGLSGYALPASASVNYYSSADGAVSLGLLAVNTLIAVLASPTESDGMYTVTYEGNTVYVRNGGLTLLTPSELAALLEEDSDPTNTPGAILGYVRITPEGDTNLRLSPASATRVNYLQQGDVLPYYAAPVTHKGFEWLYVRDPETGSYGYVRSDCYVYCDSTGSAAATATVTQAPSATPTATAAVPGGAIGFIRTKLAGSTWLRSTPNGTRFTQVDYGTILPYFALPVRKNGNSWVYTRDPASGSYGYILEDCIEYVNESGTVVATATITPVPTATPTATATPVNSLGNIVLIKGGVNLRSSASTTGERLSQIDIGTVLPYFSITNGNGYAWYYVLYGTVYGYIRGDTANLSGDSGAEPTATPDGTVYGYVLTKKSSVNLRTYAKSDSASLLQLAIDTVWPMMGTTVQNGGYSWYYIKAGEVYGYLRGDCVVKLTDEQAAAYIATGALPTASPTPSPTPAPTEYIVTILDDVYLRASASKSSRAVVQLPLGTVLKFTGSTVSGGAKWYKVIYDSDTVYMLGTCAKVMNDAEYAAYLAALPTATPSPVPTATPSPSPTPSLADLSDTALTRSTNIIVRSAGNGTASKVTKLYASNQVCTLTGSYNVDGEYIYYQLTVAGVSGWIRGDLLRILTDEEAEYYKLTGDPDAPREATYTSLSKGSTGEAVRKLQQKLCDLQYLDAEYVTGTYDSATVTAVKAFQKAKKLTVDGIAGSLTQHSLYGTVETGYYEENGSSTDVTLSTVEKIAWTDMNTLWVRGTTAIVTDVKTGISFVVKRWAGIYHSDVEPLKASDTAAMCRIYGVDTAQEIADNNLYQRRAILVTYKGHTYAASMYGVPHNYPDGDTIADNDYNGQFCIHFVGSLTHASSTVDADHQAAIEYAYKNGNSLLDD